MKQDPDFEFLFQVIPEPTVILTPDLIVRHTNSAFLATTSVSASDLLDRHLIDEVFPDRPGKEAPGRKALRASFDLVVHTGGSDVASISRYDLVPQGQSRPVVKYWSPVNSAIVDDEGTVLFIVHRVQDVTAGRGLLNTLASRGIERAIETTAPTTDSRLTGYASRLSQDTNLAEEFQDQVNRLHKYVSSMILIEQAKGMLMAAHRISAEQAFAVLRDQSQNTNVKLRDVAAHHVLLHSMRFNGSAPG